MNKPRNQGNGNIIRTGCYWKVLILTICISFFFEFVMVVTFLRFALPLFASPLILPCFHTLSISTDHSLFLDPTVYKQILYIGWPIWDSATSVFSRSQRGEIGRPSSCSRSPCLKNSSSSWLVQRWWRLQSLAGWLMSAQCSTSDRAFCLSML